MKGWVATYFWLDCSEDDIDIKNIVTAWLLRQPENISTTLSQVTEDYFYKGKQGRYLGVAQGS